MVKIKFSRFVYVIIATVTIAYLTFTEKEHYYINDYRMYISVKENNSMHIVENIVYSPEEGSNGITKTIHIKDNKKVNNLNASLIYPQKKDLYFEVFNENATFDFRIFNKFNSKNEVQIIKIEYDIENIAKKYEDFSYISLNVVDKMDYLKFKKGEICLFYPDNISKNKFKPFIDAYSKQKIITDDEKIIFNIKDLSYKYGLKLNILIKNDNKNINSQTYTKILNDNERNKVKLEKISKFILIYDIVGFALCVLVVIIFILKKIKIITAPIHLARNHYNKLPKECTPAVLDYLIHEKITKYSIIATLLDLNRKGYIDIIASEDNYLIEIKKEDGECLKEHERYFLKWIFFYSLSKNTLSLEDINDINKGKNNFIKFKNNYMGWVEKVIKNADEYKYVRRKSKILFIILVLLYSICCMFGFLSKLSSYYILYLLLIFMSIYTYKFEIKSVKGYIEAKKYKKVKKYLIKIKNPSIFENRKENIFLYLIYALPLGIHQDVYFKFKNYMLYEERIVYSNIELFEMIEKSFKVKYLKRGIFTR